MDVEIEAAAETLTGGMPVDETNAWKWVAGLLGSAVVGGAGLLFRNRRSSQALEDTENTTRADALQNAYKRIRELEEQLGDLFNKTAAGYNEIGEAKRAANTASIEADNARAAAQRASEAAGHAQAMAQAADEVSSRRLAYIHELRALLIANNIPLPPFPEGVL